MVLLVATSKKYYALINRARGPYEEIFVLIFKAYGPNAVRSMRLECQNKYFPYAPKSRLIRALLYTYTNKLVYDEILLNKSVVYCVSVLPGPYACPYAYVRTASQPIRPKNSFRSSISIQQDEVLFTPHNYRVWHLHEISLFFVLPTYFEIILMR